MTHKKLEGTYWFLLAPMRIKMKWFTFLLFLLVCSPSYSHDLIKIKQKNFIDVSKADFGITGVVGSVSAIQIQWQLSQLSSGQKFRVELPREGLLEAKVSELRKEEFRTHFVLRASSDPYGRAYMVANEATGVLSGTLFFGGNTYFIHHEEGKDYLIQQNDVLYEGPHPELPMVADLVQASEVEAQAAVTEPSSDSFIDVMVVYTGDVAAIANAEDNLRSRVDATNGFLADSCANFRVRLVHIQEITYTETANSNTDLTRLRTDGDGHMDVVHGLRDTHGADLVQLVTETGSVCGLAYVSQEGFYDDEYGFSLSLYWCNARTMAHEWGHNLSVLHDRFERGVGVNEDTAALTGYGFVDLYNKKIDIMAYHNHCTQQGVICTTVNRFSNPHIHHNGVPFGIKAYSDSIRRMNQAFPYIANYRQAVTAHNPSIDKNCISKSEDKDINCFIASAAHGTYLNEELEALRSFRDHVLLSTAFGKKIVQAYYAKSPYIAYYVSKSEVLSLSVRIGVQVVVAIITYWIWFLALLSFLLAFIFFRKRALFLSLLLFVFVPLMNFPVKSLRAQIAYPTGVYTNDVINPSLPYVSSSSLWYGLTREDQSREVEEASYKQETEAEVMSFRFGHRSPGYNFSLMLTPSYKEKTKTDHMGLGVDELDRELQSFYLQTSFSLYDYAFGIRYQQEAANEKRLNEKEKKNIVNVGVSDGFSPSVRWGLGTSLIQESGDDLAKAMWFEPYLGLALGEFVTSGNRYFLEIAALRRPEVLKNDGAKLNAKPESLKLMYSAEYYSEAGFFVLKPIVFRIGFYEEKFKKLEGHFLDDEKKKTLEVDIASRLIWENLFWALGYSEVTFDSRKGDKQIDIRLSLIWSVDGLRNSSGGGPTLAASAL